MLTAHVRSLTSTFFTDKGAACRKQQVIKLSGCDNSSLVDEFSTRGVVSCLGPLFLG